MMYKKLVLLYTIMNSISTHAQHEPAKKQEQSQNPLHILADIALSKERINELEQRVIQQKKDIAGLQAISEQQSKLIKQLSESKQPALIKVSYH